MLTCGGVRGLGSAATSAAIASKVEAAAKDLIVEERLEASVVCW